MIWDDLESQISKVTVHDTEYQVLCTTSELTDAIARGRSLERVAEAAKKALEYHAILLARCPDELGRVQLLEPYFVPILEALAELEKCEKEGG